MKPTYHRSRYRGIKTHEFAFNHAAINNRLFEIACMDFQTQFDAYINHLCYRAFHWGLKPISFETFKKHKGLLPDEIFAIYEQTGNFLQIHNRPKFIIDIQP